MKQTALQFVIDYLLEKFKTFSEEDKSYILNRTTFETLVRISYSDYRNISYQKIEFDFVEQVEIQVPKTIWKIIE